MGVVSDVVPVDHQLDADAVIKSNEKKANHDDWHPHAGWNPDPGGV
jgi:hypothetical protein